MIRKEVKQKESTSIKKNVEYKSKQYYISFNKKDAETLKLEPNKQVALMNLDEVKNDFNEHNDLMNLLQNLYNLMNLKMDFIKEPTETDIELVTKIKERITL